MKTPKKEEEPVVHAGVQSRLRARTFELRMGKLLIGGLLSGRVLIGDTSEAAVSRMGAG